MNQPISLDSSSMPSSNSASNSTSSSSLTTKMESSDELSYSSELDIIAVLEEHVGHVALSSVPTIANDRVERAKSMPAKSFVKFHTTNNEHDPSPPHTPKMSHHLFSRNHSDSYAELEIHSPKLLKRDTSLRCHISNAEARTEPIFSHSPKKRIQRKPSAYTRVAESVGGRTVRTGTGSLEGKKGIVTGNSEDVN
mmetsp:Transcript_14369/g.24711  ORF Transcript_14369/g.24711 Transcript_14369/m.24711 type:complete len:195 (+) Transcript_14369:3135-3719(+)